MSEPESERLVDARADDSERALEGALRPRQLDEFIGVHLLHHLIARLRNSPAFPPAVARPDVRQHKFLSLFGHVQLRHPDTLVSTAFLAIRVRIADLLKHVLHRALS